MEEREYPHRPVLVDEVVKVLTRSPDGVYADGTVGSGGHSEAILRSLGNKGRLICLDRDSDAVLLARQRLAPFGERVTVLKGSYADLDSILADSARNFERWSQNYGLRNLSAQVTVLEATSAQIHLRLTSAKDPALYDEPLTLRTQVPADWSACLVAQGRAAKTCPVASNIVQYEAIPGSGEIVLTPSAG